jgi:hypothetical protein
MPEIALSTTLFNVNTLLLAAFTLIPETLPFDLTYASTELCTPSNSMAVLDAVMLPAQRHQSCPALARQCGIVARAPLPLQVDELDPLGRDRILREGRADRTFRLAGTTVDGLVQQASTWTDG